MDRESLKKKVKDYFNSVQKMLKDEYGGGKIPSFAEPENNNFWKQVRKVWTDKHKKKAHNVLWAHLSQEEEPQEPSNAFEKVKKALIIDVLLKDADMLVQKKLETIYKKLSISEINDYIHFYLNDIYMQKANIPQNVIKRLEKASDMKEEISALSLGLNAVHHSGSALVDYVGLFSEGQLNELSNISQSEIKKYKKNWGV